MYLKKAIGFLEKARSRRGSGAGGGHRRPDSVLSDRRPEGLAPVRRATGSATTPTVDFANGFIEVYRDARGAKGSSQSFVTITDKPVTDAMAKLADERRATSRRRRRGIPKYKKQSLPAARRQGGRGAHRDRRLPRHDDRRQPAERKRNSRKVRHQELPALRAAAMRSVPAVRQHDRRVRRVAGGNRARQEVRRGGRRPADRDARSDRPRLGQAERSAQGRRRAVPEGILLDARRGARRPDGAVECLGSRS